MFFSEEKALHEIRGSVFTRPPTTFDPVFGYRWNPGVFRFVRVIRGELVCDNLVRINSLGYHSHQDYAPGKPSPRGFRIIVLGDSFTNDLAVDEAWPDALQRLLRSRPEHGREIEVLGMPTDGGGLLNWYHTFKYRVLPEFDLDVLVLADWGDDLGRKFAVCHSTAAGVYWGTFEHADRPTTQAAFEQALPGMTKLYEVADDDAVEQLVTRLKVQARPGPWSPDDCRRQGGRIGLPPPGYRFSPQAFVDRYGAQRFEMLAEIVAECRQRNVRVIYCPMPSREGVLQLQEQPATLLHQAQGQGLCEHFGMDYFDGYEVFRDLDAEAVVGFLWLKYDGHWAKGASSLFALRLAEWLLARGILQGANHG
jgi:rRNA maturation protein Nop10